MLLIFREEKRGNEGEREREKEKRRGRLCQNCFGRACSEKGERKKERKKEKKEKKEKVEVEVEKKTTFVVAVASRSTLSS